jgi:hypothetical protein
MKCINPAPFETWKVIVRNSRKLHKAILLWATISVLSSCQRAPTNDTTQISLKERVEALNNETVGAIDLGRGYAYPTKNSEFIISHKDEAVPILVEALKDERKPIKVGHVAYILRRIDSDKGREAAAETSNKLSAKGSLMSFEERFALGELRDYLDHVKERGSAQVSSQTPTKDKCDFSKRTSLRAQSSHGSSMLSFPKPHYPPEAKERGAQGTVAVLLLVNVRTGLVEQTCVIEGDETLHAAATEAALRVKFSPYSRYIQEKFSYAEERVVYGFRP